MKGAQLFSGLSNSHRPFVALMIISLAIGCIKFHKLLYQSCLENLQLIDSVDTFQNSWELSAPAMNGLAEYFSSKAEEMTMKFNDIGIVLQTFNDAGDDSGTLFVDV